MLPELSDPSIVPICAVFGAVLAGALARARGRSRKQRREATEDGAFYGGLGGLCVYLGALAALNFI